MIARSTHFAMVIQRRVPVILSLTVHDAHSTTICASSTLATAASVFEDRRQSTTTEYSATASKGVNPSTEKRLLGFLPSATTTILAQLTTAMNCRSDVHFLLYLESDLRAEAMLVRALMA
ncbi:MAG: hypothetical protein ACOVQN_04280 [Exiguobacterium sp.]